MKKTARRDKYAQRYEKVVNEIRKLDRWNLFKFDPFEENKHNHRLAIEDSLLFRILALRSAPGSDETIRFSFQVEVGYCCAALDALDKLESYNQTIWHSRGAWPLEIVDAELTERDRKEGKRSVYVSFGWLFYQFGTPEGCVTAAIPTPELEQRVISWFRRIMRMEYPGIKIEVHQVVPDAITFELIPAQEEPLIAGSARVLLRDIADDLSLVR
jgi:hypothetical protein